MMDTSEGNIAHDGDDPETRTMTWNRACERTLVILFLTAARRETYQALREMAERGLDGTAEYRGAFAALCGQTAALARRNAANPLAN